MRVFWILPLTAIAAVTETDQHNLCKAMLHNANAVCDDKLKCKIPDSIAGKYPKICCGQSAFSEVEKAFKIAKRVLVENPLGPPTADINNRADAEACRAFLRLFTEPESFSKYLSKLKVVQGAANCQFETLAQMLPELNRQFVLRVLRDLLALARPAYVPPLVAYPTIAAFQTFQTSLSRLEPGPDIDAKGCRAQPNGPPLRCASHMAVMDIISDMRDEGGNKVRTMFADKASEFMKRFVKSWEAWRDSEKDTKADFEVREYENLFTFTTLLASRDMFAPPTLPCDAAARLDGHSVSGLSLTGNSDRTSGSGILTSRSTKSTASHHSTKSDTKESAIRPSSSTSSGAPDGGKKKRK